MAGSDGERIAALEARMKGLEGWLSSMDKKLDTVVSALDMGKGAWRVLMRLGAALVAIAGLVAWLTDHLKIGFR